MPKNDIKEAKKIWDITQENIKSNKIISKAIKSRRLTYFPKQTKNKVRHVRPRASKSMDTYSLPFKDKLTG